MKTHRTTSLLVATLATTCWVNRGEAAIITGESAVSNNIARNPDLAVNNSGISPVTPTDLVTDGAITHTAVDSATKYSWYYFDGTSAPADGSRFIDINLGATYNIGGMRIWNWNENDGTSFSRLDVTSFSVDTSLDDATWTPRLTANITIGTNLPLASGLDSYAGTYFDLLSSPWSNVQYVRIHILATNWGTFNAGQDNFYGGLSEVMFATAVPEPTAMFLLVTGAIGTCVFVRRRCS